MSDIKKDLKVYLFQHDYDITYLVAANNLNEAEIVLKKTIGKEDYYSEDWLNNERIPAGEWHSVDIYSKETKATVIYPE